MIEFSIKGLKELDDMLKKLPEDFQLKAGWKATIEGAKIVRDAAKAAVPVAVKPHYWYPYRGTRRRGVKRKNRERAARGTAHRILITPGLVQRSIRAIRKKQTNRGIMYYMVGPIKPFGRGKGMAEDPYYWTWLEYGKTGYSPKRFLRNAFDNNTGRVIETMSAALGKYIANANKRVSKYRLPV